MESLRYWWHSADDSGERSAHDGVRKSQKSHFIFVSTQEEVKFGETIEERRGDDHAVCISQFVSICKSEAGYFLSYQLNFSSINAKFHIPFQIIWNRLYTLLRAFINFER